MENLNPKILIESNGRVYPIIWRKKGKRTGETEKCPFCGSTHIHGKAEGTASPHCASGKGRDFVFDGVVYSQDHGYYIKEY
jgi:hypothetical protein